MQTNRRRNRKQLRTDNEDGKRRGKGDDTEGQGTGHGKTQQKQRITEVSVTRHAVRSAQKTAAGQSRQETVTAEQETAAVQSVQEKSAVQFALMCSRQPTVSPIAVETGSGAV